MAGRHRSDSLIDLGLALRPLAQAFDEAQVQYAIVGSVAASVWGVVRMTRDVDVVVVIDGEHGQAVLDRLEQAELYVPREAADRAIRNGGSFNVLHPASGGKVDVFVMPVTDEFTTQRLDDRVRVEVFDIPTWVDRAENLVLAKLHWRLETRSEVQWRDCVEIAAINDLDADYLRTWGSRLGVEADLEALLAG